MSTDSVPQPYDGDPTDAVESVEFKVERTLNEILTAMVAVHVEFRGGDNPEARRLLANIHTRIATYPPELLARCVTDLLDAQAHEEAKTVADEFDQWFRMAFGNTTSPRDVAVAELGMCPDEDGHAIAHVDVVAWKRHAKRTGRCARCGRIVTRKRGKRP